MNSSKGLVAFAVLHHVLVAFAILLLGADTKVYSVIFSVGAFGLLSIIVRRGWQVAADSAMSPGKAQGFLFIPFFNLYWVYRALPGLASALSRRADQVGAPEARRVTGFALTAAILFCIRAVTLFVSRLNGLDGLLYLVYAGFCIVFIWQVISAVKRLEASAPEARPMSTVGASAIVLGPLAAVLGLICIGDLVTPDLRDIEKKGYRLVPSSAEASVSFELRDSGVVAQRIQVLTASGDRVGTVYVVEAEGLTEAQLAQAERVFGVKAERARGKYYFKPTRRDQGREAMGLKDWVDSF